MDNIPREIIYLFFQYLNPIQAQQFSLVNKKTNFIYQNIKKKMNTYQLIINFLYLVLN